jgi:hypothetical protein
MGSRHKTKSRTIPAHAARGANPAAFDGLLDAALEIAASRREVLIRLRKALKANDAAEVFSIAKELCGSYEEKSNRTN